MTRAQATPLETKALTVDIPPDRAQEITTVAGLALPPGDYTLQVRLIRPDGEVLGENALRFRIEAQR